MTGEKKPSTEVGKLMKAHTRKKLANEVTIGKRLRTVKSQPKPKREPKGVLKLIADYTTGKHRKKG